MLKKLIEKKKKEKKLKEIREKEAEEAIVRRMERIKEYYTIHLIDADRISPSLPDEKPARAEELRSLCAAIRRYGLAQPLSVRRVTKNCDGIGETFSLIDGRKRLAALKALGVARVPCVICDIGAEKAAEAAIACRFTAGGGTLLESADLFAAYMKASGLDAEDASRALSVDEGRVKELVRAAALNDKELAVIESCGMSDALISEISAISDENRRMQALLSTASSLLTLKKAAARERKGARMLFNDITPLCNSVDRLVTTIRNSGIPAFWEKNVSDDRYVLKIVVPRRTYRLVSDHSGPMLECIRTGSDGKEE